MLFEDRSRAESFGNVALDSLGYEGPRTVAEH